MEAGARLESLEERKRVDGKIILIFKISIILIFTFSIFNLLIRGVPAILTSINVVLNGLTLAFFLTGLVSWYYYGKKHIIGYRKLFFYILMLIVLISLIFLSALFIQYRGLDVIVFDTRVALRVETFIIGLISSVLGLNLIYFFLLVMGFGIVGLLSAVIRASTPKLLEDIKGITKNLDAETKDEDIALYLKCRVIAWLFAIPPYLDTVTLSVKKPARDIKFPKDKFKTAIMWEVFLCLILAVNISLNPILLEHFSLNELFSITSSLAIFIPMIVLPWFVFLKLEAEIDGPARDFNLYEGMKNRVLSLLVATGTIITFVRLSYGRIDPRIFVVSLLGYLFGILILTVLYTFVYFNHFWEDLINDVYRSLESEDSIR